MASSVEIANLALGHIGVSQTIDNLTTEKSTEARVVNRYYKIARKEVFGEFDWPFASKVVTLALVSTDPTTEWGYEYQYPSDCVKFIKILSGLRNDTDDSRYPHEIANGSNDLTVIYCGIEDAEGKYTKLITDEELYPHDFVMAMSFRLAFFMAPTLMTGDPFKLREAAGTFAQFWINKAAGTRYNESPKEERPRSKYTRGRT